MSDEKNLLRDAFAASAESPAERKAREAQAREVATAFFERVIVPGFEAAASDINEVAAEHSGGRAPARAEARTEKVYDGTTVELGVRRGMDSDFWLLGFLRRSPAEWKYRQSPRVKRDGTTTIDGTLELRDWPVSIETWTVEDVSAFVLRKYREVVEARNR